MVHVEEHSWISSHARVRGMHHSISLCYPVLFRATISPYGDCHSIWSLCSVCLRRSNWLSLGILGFKWISMDFHGFPWISIHFHSCPLFAQKKSWVSSHVWRRVVDFGISGQSTEGKREFEHDRDFGWWKVPDHHIQNVSKCSPLLKSLEEAFFVILVFFSFFLW